MTRARALRLLDLRTRHAELRGRAVRVVQRWVQGFTTDSRAEQAMAQARAARLAVRRAEKAEEP